MCHVTAVICLFIIQEIKKAEKKRKRKIKSKKIDKRKRKSKIYIRVQVYYDTIDFTTILYSKNLLPNSQTLLL